ncbi:MAG: DUF192 domain-containing protein [Candidatus Micrarchaeota archaeon]|nr:DUF192 domain-containing protein [Candidatus Micrarchaeota archaeon]
MYLARSFAQKSIGLMYRASIRENEGMLFCFPFDHKWKIWMLNMRFPIDTVWLDSSRRAVHIERDMKPCKGVLSCRSYEPAKRARYVLELKSGAAARLKLRLGDRIESITSACRAAQ